jgi:DNA-binding transcriptional ArsR family regulator
MAVASQPDFAKVAALMGDPARATMLSALTGPDALPASELAGLAGISLPTASHHLGKLVDGGLVKVEKHGRHRYYGLAGEQVVHAVEALSALAPDAPVRGLKDSVVSDTLRAGRTCYDHLAGQLGVAVADALADKHVIERTDDGIELGDNAHAWCEELGIELPSGGRRPLVRSCLDWSERRHHIAGALGAGIATALLERGWIERLNNGRAVRPTKDGHDQLAKHFALRLG